MKDGGYKYFISVLADHTMQYEYRTMAAFILSAIVHNYHKGKVRSVPMVIVTLHNTRKCVSKTMSYQYVYHNWMSLTQS